MPFAKSAIFNLLGTTSSYHRREENAFYDIVEVVGARIVGATSVQIRV